MSIFTIISLFFARLALLVVWIVTPLVHRAFQGSWLLPLLGILFLPLTTLLYVLIYALSGNGVTGWGWLWVVLAFLFDLGVYSSPARRAARARSTRDGSPSQPESISFPPRRASWRWSQHASLTEDKQISSTESRVCKNGG